jgi:hypothetical protein
MSGIYAAWGRRLQTAIQAGMGALRRPRRVQRLNTHCDSHALRIRSAR